MKKATLFFALVLLLTGTGHTQGVLFKLNLLPSRIYHKEIKQTYQMVTKFELSKELVNVVKVKGADTPSLIKFNFYTVSVIKTGKKTGNEYFPVEMEIVKSDSMNGTKPIPDGTKYYGHCAKNSMPIYDSVSENGWSGKFKKQVIDSLSGTLPEIPFPEKEIKVGETFSQKRHSSMPINSINMEMVITTIYKFKSLKDSIAHFDIVQTYTFKGNDDPDIKAKGTGNGSLDYDLKAHYYKSYELNSYTDESIDSKTNMIHFHSESKVVHTVTVEEN